MLLRKPNVNRASEIYFIKIQFFSCSKYVQFKPFLKKTFICDKEITQNSSLKE